MDAWVREVVGHSATIAPSRRYHFATKPLPLWPSIGTTMSITVCPALVIRCFVFLLLIIRPCRPLILLCAWPVAVKDLRCAPTASRQVLDSSLRITH